MKDVIRRPHGVQASKSGTRLGWRAKSRSRTSVLCSDGEGLAGMISGVAGGNDREQRDSRPVDVRAAAMRRDRNNFRVHPAPIEPMSRTKKRPRPRVGSVAGDLQTLAGFFEATTDGRERFRWTLRDSLDELLDGQRTGRCCYQHLRKTEKTYLGAAIE